MLLILSRAGARTALAIRASCSTFHQEFVALKANLMEVLPRAVYVCASDGCQDADPAAWLTIFRGNAEEHEPQTSRVRRQLRSTIFASMESFPLVSSTPLLSGQLLVCSGGGGLQTWDSAGDGRVWVADGASPCHLPPMPEAFFPVSGCLMSGVGCIKGSIIGHEWEPLPGLPQSCDSTSAVFIEGQLYLCGGSRVTAFPPRWPPGSDEADREDFEGGDEIAVDDLLSALSEYLDPEIDTWKPVPPRALQIICRTWEVAGLRAHQLSTKGPFSDSYASDPLLGGSRVYGKSRAWRFDALVGFWETLPPMAFPRTEAAVGVVGGMLYACGGIADVGQVLSCVERFDPQTNTWESLSSMIHPRMWAGAGIHSGCLLVCGGFGVDGQPLSSAEKFDPDTNTWELITACNGAAPLHESPCVVVCANELRSRRGVSHLTISSLI